MNRLTQHLAAITPSLPEPREPRNGELIFGMMIWRASRGSKWLPRSVDAIPPFVLGRYTIIWSIDRTLPPVLRDVIDANTESLKAAETKGRVKTWAVVVRAVYGHDETATIIADAAALIGGGA